MQFPPLGILFLYKSYFPVSIPFLYLFFPSDCFSYIIMNFIINKSMNLIRFCESFHHILLVFITALHQITGNADIQCAVSFTCQYIDVVWVHVFWIPAFAGMTRPLVMPIVCTPMDSRLRGNDAARRLLGPQSLWIPAFAGNDFFDTRIYTAASTGFPPKSVAGMTSRGCGNGKSVLREWQVFTPPIPRSVH